MVTDDGPYFVEEDIFKGQKNMTHRKSMSRDALGSNRSSKSPSPLRRPRKEIRQVVDLNREHDPINYYVSNPKYQTIQLDTR